MQYIVDKFNFEVSNINEYIEFLEVINDKNHPDYANVALWASKQNYKEGFDIESVNILMKEINNI